MLLVVLGLDPRLLPVHELNDVRFFNGLDVESIESRFSLFPKNPALTLGASDPLVIETAVVLVTLSFLPPPT
jgi:hypothetical protein